MTRAPSSTPRDDTIDRLDAATVALARLLARQAVRELEEAPQATEEQTNDQEEDR
ncbi:MAG: hypothetical protein ACP5DX_17035 [Paracoccaceae bacterium]